MKREERIQEMVDFLNEKYQETAGLHFLPGDSDRYYQIKVMITPTDSDKLTTKKQSYLIFKFHNIWVKGVDISRTDRQVSAALIGAAIDCRYSGTNFVLIVMNEEVTTPTEDDDPTPTPPQV